MGADPHEHRGRDVGHVVGRRAIARTLQGEIEPQGDLVWGLLQSRTRSRNSRSGWIATASRTRSASTRPVWWPTSGAPFHRTTPIARNAAEQFYARLRELFAEGKSITSFGPYSPGQVVQMKRSGIEGIYLGGWATSAKGSTNEDPGPDLASYPLSQVPDEAEGLVRALLTADKNQRYLRSRMTEAEREATPEVDFRPFIIADADTGHGGDAHVRNLVRRFVEAGVPGYHIEDQKPGAKKCGHQGGKVLVPSDEQIKRLSAARFQLDLMGVPGIIVARTDAEAANLLDGAGDERDQPFILGVTNTVGAVLQGRLPRAHPRASTRAGIERAQRPPDLRRPRRASTPRPTRGSRRPACPTLVADAAARPRGRRDPHLGGHPRRRRRRLPRSVAGRGRPHHARPGRRRPDRLPRATRTRPPTSRSRSGTRSRPAPPGTRSATRPGARGRRGLGRRAGPDARGLLPDPGRHPVRGRQVARRGAVRRPALDGDQDRRPRGREGVRRRDPRRLPREDARLQPVAVLQLGHDRHERRRDAQLPDRAGEDGLRLQLHDLRRPPDRRPRRRGVHHGAARGRHARPGAPAAQVPPAGVALPHAADPGRRPPGRRRAHRGVRPDGHHEGDGRGLDPEPAPGPDRGPAEDARGLARRVGRVQRHHEAADGAAAAAHRRRRPARAERGRRPSDEKLANIVFGRLQDRRGRSSCRCATRTRSTRRCAASA